MRKLILLGMLVVVAIACGETAGEMLTDAGQIMVDAGDAMAPDADAQVGDCVVGPMGPQGPTGPQGAQGPAGPPGPPAAAMQFVGRSTTAFNGSQGVLTYSQACQTDFGPGVRMCNSEEVMNTVDVPALSGGPSWVRPMFVPATYGGTAIVLTDVSGVVRVNANTTITMSCGGWAGGDLGLTVDAGGSFELLACTAARTVACCGPSS